jgi:type III restriction enzyme
LIELLPFQQVAAQNIADRFLDYIDDPVTVGTAKNLQTVPFFQALASLTASGKTVILAEVISTISGAMDPAPVVLWVSKGRVVVDQSYANLLPGGKYHHILGSAVVRSLTDYDAVEVTESKQTLVFLATVGKFNRKDKKNLNIYKTIEDEANEPTWTALQQRLDGSGRRRPLIVVYDEAHNLSDQQTDLLMELEPDGFLLASATMRLPRKLGDQVEELKRRGKTDDWLITKVNSKAVADSGLVKHTVSLAGYLAPMEETISAMLSDLREAETDAVTYDLYGLPKAIYICNTNIVAGNAYQKDDPKQPFTQRQAPPIAIWRYLTETCNISASEVAIYANLSMHKDYPAPEDFVLFSGGEDDYDRFIEGNYRHVIFNLTLQEGWDDPLCYFAYVDKSMESRVQVEQVIGRVLRQPDAHHFPAERLNTAHFYVRIDKNEVFNDLLQDVAKRLESESPDIRLVTTPPGKPKPVEYVAKQALEVPATAYNSRLAVAPVARFIDGLADYGSGGVNVKAAGSRRISVTRVGEDGSVDTKWEDFEQSATVSARWVFQREVRRRFAGALDVASTSDIKFDAKIGIGSAAYKHVVQIAERVVDEYLENVYLVQRRVDPYTVGTVLSRPDDLATFTHSLHDGYDGLNPLEGSCADALDAVGHPWCRNPSRTGYGIPLISIGATTNFFPDFLVWTDGTVFAVDTKGGHILPEAAVRKLLRVEPPKDAKTRLAIRFISPGRWNATVECLDKDDGLTVWGTKQDGNRRATHVGNMSDAVAAVLDAGD